MNNLAISLLIPLALFVAGPVHAQSYGEASAALKAKDFAFALTGFKSLAEQGNVKAQEQLGRMYKNGQGTPKDEQQALVWFRKAADQGSPGAQAEVGWILWDGREVTQDESLALIWFNKAAAQGNASAQFALGLAYSAGRSVPKDEQQAVAWYEKAAQQGHEKAKTRLMEMNSKAPPDPADVKPARTEAIKDDPKTQTTIAEVPTDKDAQENLSYEKIEVGSVLKTGIGIAAFFKPIPLPEGKWIVVNKRVEEIALTSSGGGGPVAPLPFVYLTLKNYQEKDKQLFAFVMSFTPYASNINWGNRKCGSTNPKILTDDFGYSENSMLYLCSYIASHSNFKQTVKNSSSSTNKWIKNNLAALSAYPKEIEDNSLIVDVMGNQYKGRNINFSFILKREGDLFSDENYAKFARDWTHATGLSLAKVLENSATTFALPASYAKKSAQQ